MRLFVVIRIDSHGKFVNLKLRERLLIKPELFSQSLFWVLIIQQGVRTMYTRIQSFFQY
jgi:hypothetical protein